jgi:putative pre-16S rRNA nuclease
LADIPDNFPDNGPLLGLDLGSKTIGIAICDPARSLATPVTVIQRTKFTKDAEELLALAKTRKIVGLVLGLPYNMDGSEGPRAQSTRAFARNLSKLTELPIMFWDERLSTAAAEDDLIAQGMRREKRAKVIDAIAASHILASALDGMGKS